MDQRTLWEGNPESPLFHKAPPGQFQPPECKLTPSKMLIGEGVSFWGGCQFLCNSIHKTADWRGLKLCSGLLYSKGGIPQKGGPGGTKLGSHDLSPVCCSRILIPDWTSEDPISSDGIMPLIDPIFNTSIATYAIMPLKSLAASVTIGAIYTSAEALWARNPQKGIPRPFARSVKKVLKKSPKDPKRSQNTVREHFREHFLALREGLGRPFWGFWGCWAQRASGLL